MSAERKPPERPVETQALHVAAAQSAAAAAASSAAAAPTVEPPRPRVDDGDATGEFFMPGTVGEGTVAGEGTIAEEAGETGTADSLDATGVFQTEPPPAPPRAAAEPPKLVAPARVAIAKEPPAPALPRALQATVNVDAGAPDGGATGVFESQGTQAFENHNAGAGAALLPTTAGDATGEFLPTGAGVPAGGARAPSGGAGAPAADPNATVAVGAVGGYDRTVAATSDGSDGAAKPAGKPRIDPHAPRCGRYVLKKFHARGGMGEIWMAEDPSIGRQVALKRMLGQRADQIHRFLVEAQVTGQLEHPGIVPVHELGTTEKGEPFYVMKFVQGRTLQKIIEDHHARPDGSAREVEQFRLLQIFVSLCQTVAYAHSHGVLHRDLKPENVMLGPYGETILLDWGIAKVMGQPDPTAVVDDTSFVHLVDGDDDEDTQTRAGAIMGTPSYMAPEVAAGLNAEVDHRSDVYLLGATLYEILTGRQPRKAKTALEMIKQAQKEPPVPSLKINPQIPKALDAICRKAMAQRKEERYQSAMELADDVHRFVAGEPVHAFPEGPLRKALRWAKRHRRFLGRVAAGVFLTWLIGFGYAKVRESEQKRLELARETAQLKALDQARLDVKEFRRLDDEAHFFAATTDPAVSENSTNFDPSRAEVLAGSAFALAKKWGPALDQLPLAEERNGLKKELYDLYLLAAQLKTKPRSDAKSAAETLALLDAASQVARPSRGLYRLRAVAYQKLGDQARSTQEQTLADDARIPLSALDHFLRGEVFREEAAGGKAGEDGRKLWQPLPDRLEKAIEEYRQALILSPDDYWSHFLLGRCYIGLRRLPEATEALGVCVALRPEAYWGYSTRGIALEQQKRYAEAERDLDTAIQLDPDSMVSRLHRGCAYLNQHKDDLAMADFDAVLNAPPGKRLIEAAFYRGQLYFKQNKLQKGLDDFELVIKEIPRFQRAYVHRARCLVALALKDEAMKDRALADLDAYASYLLPEERKSWILHAERGRILRELHAELPMDQRKRPEIRALSELALEELIKAHEMNGRVAQLFDDVGAMLEHTGNIPLALEAYSKGIQLEPKNVKLLNKRGWVLLAVNQTDAALADFAAATVSDPTNAEAHSGLGYLLALKQRQTDAQREAELALLHGSDEYIVLHNVACIYAALSKVSGNQAQADQAVAIAILRRAVSLWEREKKNPSELDLMKGESAFEPLQKRSDFQALLRGSS